MTPTNEPILSDTLVATGAIAANRFVTFAGAQAGAGALVHGVASYAAAIGDAFASNIAGHLSVEAGAPIAANQRVKSDADGRAVPAADNEPAAAIAMRAAAGAGQFVRILRLSLTC